MTSTTEPSQEIYDAFLQELDLLKAEASKILAEYREAVDVKALEKIRTELHG